ncbi:MerR family transcriptional regulator [Saccharothrix syringae]|uniref:MerR family transcriptional regulator n=1 Tax=Saccharothrix syringae TaxID=103733 RepID=A0A5Q0H5P3_SACSY|nr:MerR family transcriptional regulator [Saccharothrix syringae]QFZ21507.1 MerR family transcriptional regulator [Saccharothrix syringae]
MNGDALHSIGDLARRTGLTVKAVRFYSDRGIVPPTGRSPAGHRLYGADAVARLELVRALRDLGVGLADIRRVVDREVGLPELAAAHAEALAVQIRVLRLRRAVAVAVARRGSSPREVELVHRLAKLSEDERGRLVDDFLNAVFGGLDGPAFAGVARTMTPELPDDPEVEQVEAWVELAELTRDAGFRDGLRELVRHHVGDGAVPRPDPVAVVRDLVAPALAAGLSPLSPEADRVVAEVTTAVAARCGLPGPEADLLLSRLETANDPRRDRYLRLLATINGWAAPESPGPALDWFTRALRARRREPVGEP